MDDVRPTLAVANVLSVFLDNLGERQYGYGLMQETGYQSGKVYQIIARLKNAGWLEKFDDPSANPASGGPPRITYALRANAVPMARRLVSHARHEVAAPRKRRTMAAPGALFRHPTFNRGT